MARQKLTLTAEEILKEEERVERRINYLENEKKILEKSGKNFTRKARTHRLCTRGGMLEGFLVKPGEISDEKVYELLKIAFGQEEIKTTLSSILQSIPEVDYGEILEDIDGSP